MVGDLEKRTPQGTVPKVGDPGWSPPSTTAALQFLQSAFLLSRSAPTSRLDAILSRTGWNSLQIAILSGSAATGPSCASRKSVIDLKGVFLLKRKGLVGKGRSRCVSLFENNKSVIIINMACFDKFQNKKRSGLKCLFVLQHEHVRFPNKYI